MAHSIYQKFETLEVIVLVVLLHSVLLEASSKSSDSIEDNFQHTTRDLSEYVDSSRPFDSGISQERVTASTAEHFLEESDTHSQTSDSDEDLSFTTEDINNCARGFSTLQYQAFRGFLLYNITEASDSSQLYGTCIIEVTLPVNILIVKSEVLECMGCRGFTFHNRLSNEIVHTAYGCRSDEEGVAMYTDSNKVEFKIRVSSIRECVFSLKFTGVLPSEKPQTEVQLTSNTTGFVQTPGWDGKTRYPPYMDSWSRVDVPDGHVVMISFLNLDVNAYNLDCVGHYVTLYTGGNSSTDKVWKGCRNFVPAPAVYDTEVFFVNFVSHSRYRIQTATGFRLLFSFHNRSALPVRLSDGKWNCSVPYWADFQQHFLCNLIQECAGMDDEADCPYTTDVCGPGLISVGTGCFIFMRPENSITWDEASDECLLRGAHLASFNTRQEWLD
ncbi:hypothetical protein BaRGS_00024014, partial [Batillaria attramentaria]